MDWLEEIKKIARAEAELFLADMERTANKYSIEPVWFIEEVLLNVRKMKGGAK